MSSEESTLSKLLQNTQVQGLLGGGSIGLGLGLLNILRDLITSQRKEQLARGASKLPFEQGGGGDTVEIGLPPKKAVLVDWLGVAGAGAGTYYLSQLLYKEWRKRLLKKDLASAEGEYLQALSFDDKGKQASLNMSPSNLALDLPKDLLWLALLGSGAASYAVLENTFPKAKKVRRLTPKKVVVRGHGTVLADGKGDDKDLEKQACEVSVVADDLRSGVEAMSMTLLHVPDVLAKSAMVDIAGKATADPVSLLQMLPDISAEDLPEACAGGRAKWAAASPLRKRAAVMFLSHHPAVAPLWAAITCGEMHEVFPGLSKQAASVFPEEKDLLVKMAAAWAGTTRAMDTGGKTSFNPASSLLGSWGADPDVFEQANTLSASDSEDSGGGGGRDADRAYAGEKDPITLFLSGKRF